MPLEIVILAAGKTARASFHEEAEGVAEALLEEGRLYAPLQSVGLSFGADGAVDFSDQVEYTSPPRPIGDLYTFNAELALEMGQPYPGDAVGVKIDPADRRFCVYRTTETQYVIMDSIVDDKRLIDDAHLHDPHFELGLWYAREQLRTTGNDPLFVTLEDRYTTELGDALMIGARTMLEHAHWDGVENSSTFSRFHIQDATEGKLTIMDFEEELQFLLPRALLLDQKFDLVNWFSGELESCKRDIRDLTPECLEFELLTNADVPVLEEVTDSDGADVESDGQSICIDVTREPQTPRRIGDLLEEAMQLILEVSQPYPGDERPEDDGRLQQSRFDVTRVSNNRYLVRDKVRSAENDVLEGFADAMETSYLGGLFNDGIALIDEFELFCGKAQIPADGYNGLRRTASMPKTPNRVVAKPLVVVAHVNNQPVCALIDSGSLGDLISATVADQLHLRRSEMEDPIVLQLAIQGSHSRINHSVSVDF
ncbi:hypothetical protein B0H14DRAFT_3426602 [Mycena olivaceomarginata]|nr:hypothetical protein B0H14DRAFT_3426602 [Mycena olivaceomarginata]